MKKIKAIFIVLILAVFGSVFFLATNINTDANEEKEYPYDITFREIESKSEQEINYYTVKRSKGKGKIELTMEKNFDVVEVYNTENFTKVVVRVDEENNNKTTKRYYLETSKYKFIVETEDGEPLETKDKRSFLEMIFGSR